MKYYRVKEDVIVKQTTTARLVGCGMVGVGVMVMVMVIPRIRKVHVESGGGGQRPTYDHFFSPPYYRTAGQSAHRTFIAVRDRSSVKFKTAQPGVFP